MARTVTEVLDQTARDHGSRPALKVKRGGSWQATTWSQYRDQTRLAARGFMKLGLEAGQGVAIIGYNCPEWMVADLAAIYAGGAPAGIYTTSSPEQCQYITDHCDAAVVVVENAALLAKFREVRDQLPKVKAFVLMQGSDTDPEVHSWQDLLKAGEEIPEGDLEARVQAQGPEDLCTLIYTSGTTGPPKAVMISHNNLTWTARVVQDTVGGKVGDNFISYLPLSHIAEQMVSVHGPMVNGGCTWYAESLDKLGDNLREVRPDIFLAVPRVWEKIMAKMQLAGAENKGLKKKLISWAKDKGLQAGYAQQNGDPKPFMTGLADKLVFSKVREKLGLDRCRYQVTSAAPISKETLEFFLSLGVPIYEIYGMSECTGPATISLPHKYRTGKAGFEVPGTELKIASDGEVCMKGPHVFMGYLKNPDATSEALDEDGWLHSGDIGEIDADGFLQITDRKKDLLITAGGENIAPQLIEGKLRNIAAIGQAVVIGDRRKFLSALVTLDPERLKGELEAAGSPAPDMTAAATDDKMRAYIQTQIDAVNAGLARVQTIKKFTIIPGEFSIEGGEMTPTMKIKRKVVREKYQAEIEAFYA